MQYERTALMCSAQKGHHEVAKLLLDRNANTEQQDKVTPRDMMSGRDYWGGYGVIVILGVRGTVP